MSDRREYMREWREKNGERIAKHRQLKREINRVYYHDYYKKHSEKIKAYSRQYYYEHRDERLAYMSAYRKRKRERSEALLAELLIKWRRDERHTGHS
jgi:hypothetical protein